MANFATINGKQNYECDYRSAAQADRNGYII
jgi:hypothetical protein